MSFNYSLGEIKTPELVGFVETNKAFSGKLARKRTRFQSSELPGDWKDNDSPQWNISFGQRMILGKGREATFAYHNAG